MLRRFVNAYLSTIDRYFQQATLTLTDRKTSVLRFRSMIEVDINRTSAEQGNSVKYFIGRILLISKTRQLQKSYRI